MTTLLAALGLASCLGSGNSVNLYGGTRTLDTSDFGALDDQIVYGGDIVLKVDLPLLAVEGGWQHAEQDDSSTGGLTDAELKTDEYFVGLRLVPWEFLIAPYASAGVVLLDGSLDATGVSDSDDTFGYYARLGAAFKIGFLRLGLDGRALFGSELDLGGSTSDFDNLQVTAFVGVGF